MSRGAPCALAIVAALVVGASALAHPGSGIAVDAAGVVYFVDTGSGLQTIDAAGKLVPIPSPRFHWMALDPGDRWATARLPPIPGGEIARVGSKPTVLLSSDVPLAIASDGNLYFPARVSANAVDLVRLSPAGVRSVVARIRRPYVNGLATGPGGSVYYTENAAIRRIDTKGEVTTVAENVARAGCPSIPGTDPTELRGLAVAADGTAYAAASGCGRVMKVAPGGEVATVLQTESPWSPTAVALSGSDLYVLEYLHAPGDDRRRWIPRVRKIAPDGTSAILATVRRD